MCATRYGNVMASRGSVIPLFVEQMHRGEKLTITDPEMTRFMMTLEDAVALALFAFHNGGNGDIFVKKAPGVTLATLSEALRAVLGRPGHGVEIIGTRHGEKLHETLLSREEMAAADDIGAYFRIPPDLRDLNYGKFVEHGETRISRSHDYTSSNTTRLNVDDMKAALAGLAFIKRVMAGQPPRPDDWS